MSVVRFRAPHRYLVSAVMCTAMVLSTSVAAAGDSGQGTDGSGWRSLNTAFVARDGAALTVSGKPFRFAGTNIYWLGLDENVGGVGYPTFFRIRDALDTAKAMGLTVVRSHMLASTGNELSILPSKEGGFNESAFATVDYAIAYAATIGIRLILPLTDEWEYYHGGHRDFTNPYGLPSEAFYTDPRVIADYQTYVEHVTHRHNRLTGVAYNEDPTIVAWEFGNELEGMTLDWINANAERLRAWAPRQLVAAGRRFDIDPDTLAAPGVDIVDVHYYPPTAARVRADAAAVTGAGKVYVAGEYASTAASEELLRPLAADPAVTGMLSWSLFGHHDRNGFVQHDDGFTMHYPGDDARMAEAVGAQLAFARTMSATPNRRSTVRAPLITEVAKRYGLNVLRWRGAAGAAGYRVERSRGQRGPWRPAHGGLLTDNQTPWTDPTSPGDLWYRVMPVDRHGRDGEASEPVQVRSSDTVLVDPLETLDIASDHSGVVVAAGVRGASVRPDGSGPAAVTWKGDSVLKARFDVIAARDPRSLGLQVQVSDDGEAWRTVQTTMERSSGYYRISATTGSADWVRVRWTGHHGGTSAALARATFWSADQAPPHAAPGTFTLLTPGPGETNVVGPEAFSWSAASEASIYTLTVSRRADLTEPVIQATGLVQTSYVPVSALAPSTTYHWRVTAINARGATASAPATFTTRALPTAPAMIDDFESFPDSSALAAAYVRNPNGDAIAPALVAPDGRAGQAMQLDVTLGSAGYAGVTRTFAPPLDLWGQQGIELWIDETVPGTSVTIQFVTAGIYREHTVTSGATGRVRIPFADFAHPGWAPAGPLDLRRFEQLSFYVGGSGTGQLTVDEVAAYPVA